MFVAAEAAVYRLFPVSIAVQVSFLCRTAVPSTILGCPFKVLSVHLAYGIFSCDMQLVQLAASGNFEDALALCKLLPLEDTALRVAKEDSLHRRYLAASA